MKHLKMNSTLLQKVYKFTAVRFEKMFLHYDIIYAMFALSQHIESIYYLYKKQKIFSENEKDLGMACPIPPLKKAKKQGEMPLPSLGLIPFKKI